ncbi:hypothetical protein V7146_16220 [Gottfriedia acidiceleris]|uniref:hypothetical protein n=1 Tax=Gottfriedia acidiceleris TaxID=371036 RepID=UPI0030007A5E
MGIAILFRRNPDLSPFKDALLKLLQTSGSKLILSSGFIDYSITQSPLNLIDKIVDDFDSTSQLNEIIIIGGQFDDQKHELECKHVNLPFFGKLLGTSIKGSDLLNKDIYKYSKHIRRSEWNDLYLGIEDEIRAKYRIHPSQSVSTYTDEIESMRDELIYSQIQKIINISHIASGYSAKNKCWYCNFSAFIWLLRYKLSIRNPDTVVRVVFSKKDLKRLWHSKIALKVSEDNIVNAGLIGSSNLTGAAVREDSDYFNYESDIYLWKNGVGVEIEQKDFEVITVSTTGDSPDEEQLLNEMYKGIRKYLDNN